MIRILLILVFSCHLGILLIYNIGKQIYNKPILMTEKYIDPFFSQQWEMFAPPPQHNTNLFYQFEFYKNGYANRTKQYEILGSLYKKQLSKHSSFSRLSYFLFNCCQDITENQIDGMLNLAKIKDLNEKSVNRLLEDSVYKMNSHKSLIKHASLTLKSLSTDIKYDSVYVSYTITHDKIFEAKEKNWKISSKFLKLI